MRVLLAHQPLTVSDTFETARIVITKHLTSEDTLIEYDTSGDAEEVLTAVGMLTMTIDSILHPPEEEDGEE